MRAPSGNGRDRGRETEKDRERERGVENRLVPRDGSWLLVADARRIALFVRTRGGGSSGRPRVGYPGLRSPRTRPRAALHRAIPRPRQAFKWKREVNVPIKAAFGVRARRVLRARENQRKRNLRKIYHRTLAGGPVTIRLGFIVSQLSERGERREKEREGEGRGATACLCTAGCVIKSALRT